MSEIGGDLDALAAEFALGTLDAAERAQAQSKLADDPAFAAKVRLWEHRLSELHLMVEPVEPDADIWQRIKGKMPAIAPSPELPPPTEPTADATVTEAPTAPSVATAADAVTGAAAALAAASTPPPTAPAAASPEPAAPTPPSPLSSPQTPSPQTPSPLPPSGPVAAAEPTITLPPAPTLPTPGQPASSPAAAPEPVQSDVRAPMVEHTVDGVAARRKLRRWRAFATLLLLILLAMGALVAAWKYAPDRVPPKLHAVELLRLVGITVATPPPARRSAPPESQFDE